MQIIENSRIFKVQKYSIHDGPGIRTTVFFRGCPLSCWWCHNPESQAMPDPGRCSGLEEIVVSIMIQVRQDMIFYEESGGGVTFSGGEPLCQPDLLFALMKQCVQDHIHICLDTSGFADPCVLLKAAEMADLVLYDIKIINENNHLKYTGQSNRLILDNLKKLSSCNIPVKLRFPLVPGATDHRDNLEDIIRFLTNETNYRDIHVLPFHRAGQKKYFMLNMENRMKDTMPPSGHETEEARQMFEFSGFNAVIGG